MGPTLRPLAPAFIALAVFCVPALADEPLDIVTDLYANRPYLQDPPGGMDIWWQDLRNLWQAELERRDSAEAQGIDSMGEGLTFDFMINSQEDYFSDLKLKESIPTEGEAEVRAVFDNGGTEPIALLYGFIQTDDGWKISEVTRPGDEGWRLSDLLKQTR
ncbi:MAG: hypothetical protein ABI414_12585 [Devosia sp.]